LGRLGKEGERTYTALGYSGCEVDGGGGRGSGRSGGGGGHGGGGKDGQGGVDAELHVVWCVYDCLWWISKKAQESVVSKVGLAVVKESGMFESRIGDEDVRNNKRACSKVVICFKCRATINTCSTYQQTHSRVCAFLLLSSFFAMLFS